MRAMEATRMMADSHLQHVHVESGEETIKAQPSLAFDDGSLD